MSDLLSIIYSAVEILGGLALLILIISYVTYKIRTKSELKPFEKEIDKKNELKVIIKDEKRNKEIVKGALDKTKGKKKSESSPSRSSDKSSSSGNRSSSQARKSGQSSRSRHSSSAGRSGSSRSKKSSRSDRYPKIPKQQKPLPSRDKRIQILNKLHHTQDSGELLKIQKQKDAGNNNRKTNGNGFSKFYDEQDD